MTAAQAQRCDVLVVGAGGAGLRAAIAAHDVNPRLDILLINKGPVGATGATALAFSDRMAFHATLAHTAPLGADAWKHHARDIYEIGGRVSDGNLAAILAQQSQGAFEYLDALGVPFVKDPRGRARQFVTDGSEYARACYTGPDTAAQIEQTLLRRLRETPVRVREDLMLAELAVGEQGIAGAVAIRMRDDRVLPIAAGSVVLCTGGPGSTYADSVFPRGMTGDGHAAAYRAGAELVNMEFIQIGLCSESTNLACSGSMMRCVPRFVNEAGEEFLARYMPHGGPADIANLVFAKGATWPVSAEKPSHIIDIAVASEIARGSSVYLDFSRDPEGFSWANLAPEHRARFKSEAGGEATPGVTPLGRLEQINAPVVEWLERRLIRLRRGERMLIRPKAQHFQGGIKINHRAETKVRGLFAAGECAGGQHGANRPGGNALLDTQVFGRIAGENAARRAAVKRRQEDEALRRAAESLEERLTDSRSVSGRRARAVAAGHVLSQVGAALSRAAGVIRTRERLEQCLGELQRLPRHPISADAKAEALEALSSLTVAEMILRAALMRDESRGPHLRFAAERDLAPIPSRPEWERYIVVSRAADGSMRLRPRRPKPLPFS